MKLLKMTKRLLVIRGQINLVSTIGYHKRVENVPGYNFMFGLSRFRRFWSFEQVCTNSLLNWKHMFKKVDLNVIT